VRAEAGRAAEAGPQWLEARRWLALLAAPKITLIGAGLMGRDADPRDPRAAGGREPDRMDVASRLSTPSSVHWFGTTT